MIGEDLNPSDDIVYMNMTSLWHIGNWLRAIDAGWIIQLNGDVTFKMNRRRVAALTLGVSSLGHVSNPLCWALIPETTEGEIIYSGTYQTFRDAVILVLKSFVCCCDDCEACWMVHKLRNSPRVKKFMRSDEYKAGKLHVDATLCDHHFGFHNFTREEFGFEANTCVNHTLGIGAANYTHPKYFRSGDNYDEWKDCACCMSEIDIEAIRIKADVLMQEYMEETLGDPEAYRWWSATLLHGPWSQDLGSGPFAMASTAASLQMHGTEREWREDKEQCSPKSSLGTYLGTLFHTIESKAKEHMQKLIKQ